MQHLYLLIPNLTITKTMTKELVERKFPPANIHVIGENSAALKQAHLHEANLIQTSDLVPSLIRGGLIGAAFSFILCSLYVYLHTANINYLIMLTLIASGIAIGAWISSLIGVSVDNPIVEKFKKQIKSGYYVVVLDCHLEDENTLVSEITKHYAEIKVVEST